MKILVLTPIYPAVTNAPGVTPIVHYFTKEWVKMGHTVQVCHLCAKFPSIYYSIARPFQHFINSHIGMIIPILPPEESEEYLDGVKIRRILMKKLRPHGRYRKSVIETSINEITEFIEENTPDVIVAHWTNPQLEILYEFKKKLNIPTCLVLHSDGEDIIQLYGAMAVTMISSLNLIGFRSQSLKRTFEEKFGVVKDGFIAYSGVSDLFTKQTMHAPIRTFQNVRNYIFVGSLIRRKYPVGILKSLLSVYKESFFTMKYIGEGREEVSIKKEINCLNIFNNVILMGRIDRAEIVTHLMESDIFIMISKDEVFGLVYLEAMVLGCIPIASRGEGMDGIIRDGINGFLCEAGNYNELSSIIARIKDMPPSELCEISKNAVNTALCYTDSGVSQTYLNSILNL